MDFSRVPHVRRDLAVEIDEKISAQAMLDALKKAAPGIVADIALFDVNRGKGIN
jgi:phenylalanyl-tRNA synthetase beta chain